MCKTDWEQKANDADGGLLYLWVDQSTDQLLKAKNSNGVCFAMARDFVQKFQATSDEVGQLDFLNAITTTTNTSGGKQRIPQIYINQQVKFSTAIKEYNTENKVLNQQLDEATADKKDEIIQQLLALRKTFNIKNYGATFSKINNYAINGGFGYEIFPDIFNDLFAESLMKPCYFLMGMTREGGGHAVAFGYRPDLSEVNAGFDEIYQFFDANLGLFYFKTDMVLSDFFSVVVWDSLYRAKNYTKITVTCYPII